MRFENWQYLWPPRPEKAIPKSLLSFYGKRNWIAQVKLNGTCNVISVSPNNVVDARNRHFDIDNGQHKLWAPSEKTEVAFKNLPRPNKGWYVFVAELMHSKVAGGPKDTNYIHDILVADGEYLVGKTFEERQAILRSLFPDIDESKSTVAYHVIDKHTWLARNHIGVDFALLYEEVISEPGYEGLVVKNPAAKLRLCSKKERVNADWQVKCRRGNKLYGF